MSAVPVIMTLNGEVGTYVAPVKTQLYRSQWLRMDTMGMLRFNVDTLYVGIVEGGDFDITCTIWQNGSRDVAVCTKTVTARNDKTLNLFGTLVLDTGKLRTPRMTWKAFDIRVKSCESFAFDLSCTEPGFLHIAAFSFAGVSTDATGAKVSRS